MSPEWIPPEEWRKPDPDLSPLDFIDPHCVLWIVVVAIFALIIHTLHPYFH